MINIQVPEPDRPDHLPGHAQWLAGKEIGQWFVIDESNMKEQLYRIRRYGMKGKLQYDRIYHVDHPGFNVREKYEFTHLSHGQYCSISQKNKLYRFSLLKQEMSDGKESGTFSIGNN